MPLKSVYPDVQVPDVDIWGYIFERKEKPYSDDHVIYHSVFDSRKYNYTQVKEAAVAFGEGLMNQWDWQKGDALGIFAPNDVDFAPIVFGAFYAGGIVTPANPTYSADELTYQLKNSEAKALVTMKPFLPVALKAAAAAGIPENRIILLGAAKDETHRTKHWTSIRKTSGALRYRRRKLHPDNDVAFLCYSSGTTGLPKGVVLSSRNIVSNLLQIDTLSKNDTVAVRDKMIAVLPFFHIYGLTALLQVAIARGVEIHVMPMFDPKVFYETIQNRKITFIYVAPPILVRMVSDPLLEKYDISSLKMLTSGAAPLTKDLVDKFHKKTNVRVNQAYGLTETSPMVHALAWDEWQTAVGAVGKLAPSMQAKVVGEDGKEVAKGQPGELWVYGPNVFKGYWKNDIATKGCLTPDGWFMTGDVVVVDDKDNYYITDRLKELIKYKGFQVPPAELEGKLMSHPNVNDVAVIGVFDEKQHTEVPRAYIVAAKGRAKEDGDAIIKWVADNMAQHKQLRGGVVFVDAIPKSASGKILRRILKDQAKQEASPPKAKL